MKKILSFVLAAALCLTPLCGALAAESVAPVSVRGDVDGDERVSVSDAAALLKMLLTGQTPPETADVNNDGAVTLLDVIVLLQSAVAPEDPLVPVTDPPAPTGTASASDAGPDTDSSASDAR